MARTTIVLVLDVVGWVAIHAVVGYVVHRLPGRRFERETWLTRPRRIERDGALYVRVLRIKRWKHRLPEAGAVFAGGFDKKHLVATDDDHLAAYVRETRRAELAHWATAAAAPLFFPWNPGWARGVMVAYALVVNAPCVFALRYNRLRLLRILGRRRR